jgi:hypothetical protein
MAPINANTENSLTVLRSMVQQWPQWIPDEPLYHVGTLDPNDKQKRGESQEGPGVSFSICPESWIKIAQLGGFPTWEMGSHTASRLRFVDAHQLSEQQREELMAWGENQGLISRSTLFLIARYDDELEAVMHMCVADRRSASLEADELGFGEFQTREPGPNEEGVFEVIRPIMTDRLKAAMGWKQQAEQSALTLDALILHAARQAGLDGVYFDDDHQPERYSAPRGIVFPEKAMNIQWTRIEPRPPRPKTAYR